MTKIDRKYQQILRDLGLYQGPVDGLQGPNTTKAIKQFQELNGLSIDGILGPNTKRELEGQTEAMEGRQGDIPMSPAIEPGTYRRWPQENQDNLHRFYGNVGENQTMLELPYKMKLAWDTKTSVGRISCHEKVADSLYRVFENVKKEYKASEIKQHGFDLFGGCLNVRKIRGGNRWSTHSWGIAIDIDPVRNGLRTPWNRAYLGRPECEAFVDSFAAEGWYSLGREKNYDAMHFQACWRP